LSSPLLAGHVWAFFGRGFQCEPSCFTVDLPIPPFATHPFQGEKEIAGVDRGADGGAPRPSRARPHRPFSPMVESNLSDVNPPFLSELFPLRRDLWWDNCFQCPLFPVFRWCPAKALCRERAPRSNVRLKSSLIARYSVALAALADLPLFPTGCQAEDFLHRRAAHCP